MTQTKILVVDDERTLCDVLKLNLNIEGYQVDTAFSAEEAMNMDLSSYQLILLDVMMGEMSGFDFMTWLRNKHETSLTPVIFCTAKSDEEHRIEGLMRGADDYICKPFSMKELLLRVKGVLRRTKNIKNTGKIQFDKLIIDPLLRKCTIEGEVLDLTKKEFDLLYVLLSHTDTILSREDILSSVWDNDVLVVDRSVDVTINRLRRKIGKYAECITTKHGRGYGFINQSK